MIEESSITFHDLGRISSPEPIDLIIDGDPIYDGCGITKTCFGLPSDCVEQQSCEAVVTAVAIDNRYQFELQSDVGWFW